MGTAAVQLPVHVDASFPASCDGDAIHPLSAREMDVIRLLADGKTYKEIGQILGLSWKTVDCYSQRIKLKTQCHSLALLIRCAIRNGWIEP